MNTSLSVLCLVCHRVISFYEQTVFEDFGFPPFDPKIGCSEGVKGEKCEDPLGFPLWPLSGVHDSTLTARGTAEEDSRQSKTGEAEKKKCPKGQRGREREEGGGESALEVNLQQLNKEEEHLFKVKRRRTALRENPSEIP